ncbi:hypothetical protein DEFDS_P125 (plasmid) [Deferribacter desulfuricans SSM1]|uniref:HicB-like antitoxin of toxin-antitoxin system domain-containing protein n=1 Tax=Deferribacter desulfuricans (strain DSM 14783 / JCM 11476 / NBRC 101012 / SSM1) TaxID=639282 RepID=D3PEV5_DEFDS|nr:hypothetical protein [Deferribacter desulfuricans]BAI81747.1 hypothetical protein DEFDS_P125 [Deferribacter desulfuricans SSM1]
MFDDRVKIGVKIKDGQVIGEEAGHKQFIESMKKIVNFKDNKDNKNNKNRKSLEYYLNLKYKIIIEKIDEEDGGGFDAYIKELGKYTCCACGETVEEAYNSLIEFKNELIKKWYEEGKEIPEPE